MASLSKMMVIKKPCLSALMILCLLECNPNVQLFSWEWSMEMIIGSGLSPNVLIRIAALNVMELLMLYVLMLCPMCLKDTKQLEKTQMNSAMKS